VSKILAAHWPHMIFVGIGVIAFLWVAYRPERTDDGVGGEPVEPVELPGPASKPASVKRSVARRGLLALGPLLGAVATGAVLYGLDVGGGPIPGAVIWVHSGISMLALLLVVYKVADLGLARIRRALHRDRAGELVSIILGVVSVPLLVTGIGLLFAPGTGSFLAYSHLISAAWWTGLMVWHLRRYVGASLRAVFSPPQAAQPQAPAAAASALPVPALPVTLRGDRVQWRTSGE
jgi:hypothetical protein